MRRPKRRGSSDDQAREGADQIAIAPPSTWISDPVIYGRLIRRQEQNGVGHLIDLPRPPHRNDIHPFGTDGGIGGPARCAHWRHDAGMHRVGADLVLRVLHRRRFRHQPHRRLRSVVGHVDVFAADDAGDRGQVHDGPAACRAHRRDSMLDAEKYPGRIDRHDAMPSLGAVKVLFRAAGNAGVVHQHIQLAEMPRSGRHHGGPAFLVCDIEPLEERSWPDCIDHLPTFMLEHIGNDHLGAFAGEHACGGSTHARSGTAYDGDLACQSHDGVLPLLYLDRRCHAARQDGRL